MIKFKIESSKEKLSEIEDKVKNFFKRKEVKISFEQPGPDTLYIHDDIFQYNDSIISINEIINIDLSMCSSTAITRGLIFSFMNYYVDVDIHTHQQSYLFQIMNDDAINPLLDYLINHSITINDPIGLIPVYHQYTDKLQRYKYIEHHFSDWAKEYHLDNPRGGWYKYNPSPTISDLEEYKQATPKLSLFERIIGKTK